MPPHSEDALVCHKDDANARLPISSSAALERVLGPRGAYLGSGLAKGPSDPSRCQHGASELVPPQLRPLRLMSTVGLLLSRQLLGLGHGNSPRGAPRAPRRANHPFHGCSITRNGSGSAWPIAKLARAAGRRASPSTAGERPAYDSKAFGPPEGPRGTSAASSAERPPRPDDPWRGGWSRSSCTRPSGQSAPADPSRHIEPAPH